MTQAARRRERLRSFTRIPVIPQPLTHRKLLSRGLLITLALVLSACSDPLPSDAGPAADRNEAPARFVGSLACQACHEAEYAEWQGSHHELAMQPANPETVLGNFDDRRFEYFDSTTRFFRRGGDFYVETANSEGEQEEFRIAYTFGVEPLQQYLIEFPGGRLQALPFTWDTRPASEGGQRWFHLYPDENIAPGDELHWTGRQQNWNYMCAECHSTNVDMGYDAETDSFTTTYSEINVGCEGCHGPGSTHIEHAGNDTMPPDYGLAVDLDDLGDSSWVMNTETGIAERRDQHATLRQPEACGRCHARRGMVSPDYEYGKPLADTHMPALLEESLYFADGQILEEVYVYGSFLQSRMYRAGVTCTDCHEPHSADLRTGADPNDVCGQCHLPTTFATLEHAGHDDRQAGCVDCHMVSRTYMVIDDRHDHSFRIPRPDLSESAASPNACNGCHTNQDTAWAASAIDRWRGADAGPRPHYANAIHAGRSGYANDQLRDIIDTPSHPGIARATAVSLLAWPFGSSDISVLESQLGSADPLVRIAALRQLRDIPAELRLRLPGAALLADPVRGVRLEAAFAYAGTRDLLPVETARAYVSASEELRESYRALANRPEALVALAGFEIAERDVPAALGLYERALALDPRADTARVNLADALRGLGQEAQAEAELREGLGLDEDNAALRHALGLSLVRSQRTDEALAELQTAAELAPDNARYAYVYGVALNSLGRPDMALRRLADAYERFPGNYDVAMALATIRRDSGDIEGALAVARNMLRLYPEDPNASGLLRSLGSAP